MVARETHGALLGWITLGVHLRRGCHGSAPHLALGTEVLGGWVTECATVCCGLRTLVPLSVPPQRPLAALRLPLSLFFSSSWPPLAEGGGPLHFSAGGGSLVLLRKSRGAPP